MSLIDVATKTSMSKNSHNVVANENNPQPHPKPYTESLVQTISGE